MDDIVLKAMAKWPNVPDCHGWLGLDVRGQWWMRDDQTQACGSFQSGRVGSKGSLLQHSKLIDFIGRNYAGDPHGCWYFQNGPQRVYVELEATPWIWRVHGDGQVQAHNHQVAHARQAWLDEQGRLYLLTDLGFGLVHTLDMLPASECLERGLWSLQDIDSQRLPEHFHYVLSPQQANKRPT